MNKEKITPQILTGEVMHVSDCTARVRIGRTKIHPIYRKRYSVHTQLLAEVPQGVTVEKGQTVSITPTRPLSKRKSWIVKSAK